MNLNVFLKQTITKLLRLDPISPKILFGKNYDIDSLLYIKPLIQNDIYLTYKTQQSYESLMFLLFQQEYESFCHILAQKLQSKEIPMGTLQEIVQENYSDKLIYYFLQNFDTQLTFTRKPIGKVPAIFFQDQLEELNKYKQKIQYGEKPYEILLDYNDEKQEVLFPHSYNTIEEFLGEISQSKGNFIVNGN